jgi:hypothetical protein
VSVAGAAVVAVLCTTSRAGSAGEPAGVLGAVGTTERVGVDAAVGTISIVADGPLARASELDAEDRAVPEDEAAGSAVFAAAVPGADGLAGAVVGDPASCALAAPVTVTEVRLARARRAGRVLWPTCGTRADRGGAGTAAGVAAVVCGTTSAMGSAAAAPGPSAVRAGVASTNRPTWSAASL